LLTFNTNLILFGSKIILDFLGYSYLPLHVKRPTICNRWNACGWPMDRCRQGWEGSSLLCRWVL